MKKLLLILILSIPSILYAGKPEQIDSLMNAYYSAGLFNGAALVSENGKVIYKKAFGLANMEWNIPNTTNTKFRIASISKQFTSLLVLKQVELGVLKLNDPVSKYIAEYPKSKGDSITIHHLLVQTSGIPSYDGIQDFFPKFGRLYWEPEDFIKLFWDLNLLHSPGAKHRYASFNHYLAGVILEEVTGKSYEELFQTYISTPCGLKDTKLDNHINLEKNRANGYKYSYNGYQNAPYRDMSTLFSAGAIISSVEDFYKYDKALRQDKLLSPEMKKIFYTPSKSDYACAWRVYKRKTQNDSVTIAHHTGGLQGFGAKVTQVIDDNHLIVLLQNVSDEPVFSVNPISTQILSILYNEPCVLPKESICKVLLEEMLQNGVKNAIADYDKKRKDMFDKYNFGTWQILHIGRKLLDAEKYVEAIEILEHVLPDYHNQYRIFNMLGELYLKIDKNEKAIEYFNISLDIEPGNKSALEMISKITEKSN